jgi:AbrB family looped-hinge helix DNA binding protein
MTYGNVNAMKTEMIQMDKAGRVVLPKPLRDQFNLVPGDKLRLSVEGNGFRLEPADAGGELVRKGSVLVFTGGFAEPITTAKINELIQQEREGRITAQTGKLRKK